jgi:protein-S-isoprenylcysteine O-methyltransferase Ste14
MQPYYQPHSVGILYYLALLAWYSMEITQYFRQRQWRKEVARIGPRGYLATWGGAVIVAVTMLFLAPHIVPAAEIGHGGIAFAIGIVLVVAGVALRVWAFQALGQYFTFTVKTSHDQPVVTTGPYRMLRHPGYAGGMLAIVGLGLLWGNWVSMATLTLLWLALIIWRIRYEENALLTTLDASYRAYASQHKRLVPLVW